jgi:hypothetical protein
MIDPKPTRIVYAKTPRERPAPAVAAVLTGSRTVTATQARQAAPAACGRAG